VSGLFFAEYAQLVPVATPASYAHPLFLALHLLLNLFSYYLIISRDEQVFFTPTKNVDGNGLRLLVFPYKFFTNPSTFLHGAGIQYRQERFPFWL
jgi:hypothetical protein